MAGSEDLINFDVIETQKENIQSLPGGRSAKTLASMFSPSPLNKTFTPTPSDTRNLNDLVRQGFEEEVLSISESDDPLDVYDRYVKWTLDAYPSAQATPQSQLLPLLERATKAFLTSTHYKNDPRYLKLWLHFIRFFSDSPRETFAFLARHNVGEGLALFYEEFAAWLEGAGRWTQAEEVYKTGIEREARPVERLMRKFGEFKLRLANRTPNDDEPASPALPTVRPVLAAKVNPFAASTPQPSDPQAARPTPAIGGSSTSRPARSKLAIFSDADAPAATAKETMGGTSRGWENIGSMEDRKKENVQGARPWAGEVLKAGGKKATGPKMTIFRDESRPKQPVSESSNASTMAQQQQVINPRTGRAERVFVNLDAIYPNPDDPSEEYCFEELRARRRGWLDKDWSQKEAPPAGPPETISQEVAEEEPSTNHGEEESDMVEQATAVAQTVPLKDEGDPQDDSREIRGERVKKLKVKEIKQETQTIKTNLDSPTGPKMKRKASAEPTMTFHTRAATDEIYDIFNQPLNNAETQPEDETMTTNVFSEDEDDYTSAGESTGTGRISGAVSETGDTVIVDGEGEEAEETDSKSVSEWSDFSGRKHIPKLDELADQVDQLSVTIPDEGDEDRTREDPEDEVEDDLTTHTAVSENPEISEAFSPASVAVRTRFIPIPPEDYEAPTQPFRDAVQASQNRLPFMTPIVEKTESSILPTTVHLPKPDEFNAKTPCRAKDDRHPSTPQVSATDELWSSPFQEIVNEAIPESRQIPPPALTKLVKPKTISKPPPPTASSNQGHSLPGVKDIPAKGGPIIKETQCNPVDETIRTTILSNITPPLSSYEGYFDRRSQTYNRSAELQKFTKAQSKLPRASSIDHLPTPPVLHFDGTSREYTLRRELGKGAFAPVYLVETSLPDQSEDPEEVERDAESARAVMGQGAFTLHPRLSPLEAIKSESPPTAWEFYILRQSLRRLGISRAAGSLIHAYEMHLFADECYLMLAYRDQGTLLDLVNLAKTDATLSSRGEGGGQMDEMLAMFFTIELLRVVEALHAKGIMHGDLKADNCLVRLEATPADEWSSRYQPDGSEGWEHKGLTLIDFGRGIDMKCFPPGVQFVADWQAGAQDCAEMREMRPWTWQLDMHGLAGIAHSLLFGKYLETVVEKNAGGIGCGGKRYVLKERFKRYWQVELWEGFFGLCLNPGGNLAEEEGGKMPVVRGMRRVREGMEQWLEGNGERGVGLKGLVRRAEEKIREGQGRKR